MSHEIEITDYPGKPYSSIRISSMNFIGLIDWSPNRNFGLAVGGQGHEKTAIFFELGRQKWTLNVCNPCDVRLCNDGVGVFSDAPRPGDNPELWVFQREGLLFHVSYPGVVTLKSIKVTPAGFVIESDRRKLIYSMTGTLLSEEKLRPTRI